MLPETIVGPFPSEDAYLDALYAAWRRAHGCLGLGLKEGAYSPEHGDVEMTPQVRERKRRERNQSNERSRQKQEALRRAAQMPVWLLFETQAPESALTPERLASAERRKKNKLELRQIQADEARAKGLQVCGGCLRIRKPGTRPGRGFCYLTRHNSKLLCQRCLSRAKQTPQQEATYVDRDGGESGVPAADGGLRAAAGGGEDTAA